MLGEESGHSTLQMIIDMEKLAASVLLHCDGVLAPFNPKASGCNQHDLTNDKQGRTDGCLFIASTSTVGRPPWWRRGKHTAYHGK